MPVISEDNNNDSEVEFLRTQPIASTSQTQMCPTQMSNTIPPLYSLSQDVQLSQLRPISSITTRRSCGIAPKKTRAQLEMESQQKFEIASKQAKAEAKVRAQEKKTAKTMQPKKEDVLQLINDFSELGLSS